MKNTLKKLFYICLCHKYNLSLWIMFICMNGLAQAQDVTSLKNALKLTKADSAKCRFLYDLGDAYERTQPDSSFYYFTQLLEIAKRANNKKYVARAMYKLGYMNMYYTKDETKALEWFNKSISVAKPINDYYSLARCYQIMGIISLHQGIGSPIELFYKAIEFAKKDNDWRSLNNAYAVLSNYYFSTQDYDEALKFTELAMQSSQKNDIDEWFDDGLDYCDILLVQGKKTQAFTLAKKLEVVKPQLKKTEGEFVYLNNIGRLAIILKKYSEAEMLFLRSLESERKAIKVDTFHLSFIFKNLEKLYLEQGAYKRAYQVSKELSKVLLWLKEKRQTQNSRLEMTKLKAKLDLEKKEIEITLLETQRQQQQIFLIIAGVAVMLLIAFLLFLHRNQQKIQAQKDTLSELNTTKDKLFAILSHDLRSPVASLKNYMMLINWGALSQKEFAEATNRLNTQLSNVGNSLDNVLNWAISQMEGLKPKLVKVNVSEIIEEKISLLQFTQEAKQITIYNQVSPIAEVTFDKNHFRIIIRNLLQNALKFTKNGGNITFELHKNGTTTILTITDDGVGIAKDKLANVFDLGKNDSTSGTAHEKGTGLGLVLVKELVELNGGKISVESELGKGTTFSIFCAAS
ncbi:ATP-binding protein [Emticicia aquatilis]|nr:ATP-binding protein [Emticicia aquatilis]